MKCLFNAKVQINIYLMNGFGFFNPFLLVSFKKKQ